MRRLFISLLTILTISCQAQTVAKAGDGWDLKIDSAIQLIKATDSAKYVVFRDVCQRVDFWKSSFSCKRS